jgi:CTP:molybdopterin cytidylyltransferase MocA
MTAAVVLAAGHADRMGSNKLVLPLGPGSVVGRVIAVACAAADKVIVVIRLALLRTAFRSFLPCRSDQICAGS